MDVCLLVPAYNPEPVMVDLVHALLPDFHQVIVVNDGSTTECAPLFKALQNDRITMIEHPHNRGKGAALQSGFRHWQKHHQQHTLGLVTADADGQHLANDIRKVGRSLHEKPTSLHLGVRQFSRDIPFRSAFGNQLTRLVFQCITKTALRDSQTGLRGIPAKLIESLLPTQSHGYEFETLMLLKAIQQGIPINEHPIETVYIDHNRSSNFKPIRDSYRIYKRLMQYAITGKCGD